MLARRPAAAAVTAITVVVTLVTVMAAAAGSEVRFVAIVGSIGLALAVVAASLIRSRWIVVPIICAAFCLWAIIGDYV